MNFRELDKLKELSWYTTVPLFVSAWILHDIVSLQKELTTVLGFVSVVGEYFVKVVIGLFIAFSIWLFTAVRVEDDSFPFTILLATFILTLSGVGFGVYILKQEHLSLPVNIVWFAALASLAFNLYQLKSTKDSN